MTKEKSKELSELLKAYSEGKTIQMLIRQGCSVDGITVSADTWFDIKVEDINYKEFDNEELYKYRIEPEPKLVPFTFEDSHLFLNKVVKGKTPHSDSRSKSVAVSCNDDFVWLGSLAIGLRYSFFLDEFEFEDGSPCGKYVE